MRQGPRNRSWFASLRRDRLLFALAAVLLVLSGLLEPVASVQASALDVSASICAPATTYDSLPEPARGHDPFAEHCRQCIAGPCAGLALPFRADPLAAIIPPARDDGPAIPSEVVAHLREPAGEPPPAIRAPPILR